MWYVNPVLWLLNVMTLYIIISCGVWERRHERSNANTWTYNDEDCRESINKKTKPELWRFRPKSWSNTFFEVWKMSKKRTCMVTLLISVHKLSMNIQNFRTDSLLNSWMWIGQMLNWNDRKRNFWQSHICRISLVKDGVCDKMKIITLTITSHF